MLKKISLPFFGGDRSYTCCQDCCQEMEKPQSETILKDYSNYNFEIWFGSKVGISETSNNITCSVQQPPEIINNNFC